jgi:acyl-CoA thioesterase I
VSDSRGLPSDRRASVVYVALGDSTVEGVGATNRERNYVSRLLGHLRDVYPNARMVNLGIGGATSADVLAGQLDQAIELKPDLVTLSIGPNDITTGVQVESYEHNVESILRRLHDKTRALIVVNLLPDLAVTPRFRGRPQEAAVGRLTTAFNDALLRRATAVGAEVVDLYEPSRLEVPQRPDLVARDGYHPSDAGYERWAELMWQGVQRRIGHGG